MGARQDRGLIDWRASRSRFERLYNEIAEPFGWKFTREDMSEWLQRLDERQAEKLALAA